MLSHRGQLESVAKPPVLNQAVSGDQPQLVLSPQSVTNYAIVEPSQNLISNSNLVFSNISIQSGVQAQAQPQVYKSYSFWLKEMKVMDGFYFEFADVSCRSTATDTATASATTI